MVVMLFPTFFTPSAKCRPSSFIFSGKQTLYVRFFFTLWYHFLWNCPVTKWHAPMSPVLRLDLLDLKLLPVIQRRGHTTKNSTPGDAMMGDTNCLSDGKVDDCEVLRYAVQPPSSRTASWPIVPGEKLCSFSTSLSGGIRCR